MVSKTGWQQPARCVHLGLMGAALTIGGHEVGHQWVCQCGQAFVVRMVDGKKQLVKA